MATLYDGFGNEIESTGNTSIVTVREPDYDHYVKAVNHRGWRKSGATENSRTAFIDSSKNGFKYVECDVSVTSDGVLVINHDSVISMTYGDWSTAHPDGLTLPDFLTLCKALALHPYIELKQNLTEELVQTIVSEVKKCDMHVTYIGGNFSWLGYAAASDKTARFGLLSTISSDSITKVTSLKTDSNEVFIDADLSSVTDDGIQLAMAAGVPVEVFTVNSETSIVNMNRYISGVTSDTLIAGKVIFDNVV